MNRRQFALRATLPAAGALSAACPGLALAQQWPARPVTVTVPYPPGGNTDFLARITTEFLTRKFGQSFIADNRAGAGGTIAAMSAARVAPDGYSLFFASITQISLAPFLYRIRYDPIKDFQPIANVGGNPLVLTVSASSPFRTMGDLVQYAKKNPGKLNVGHAGTGSLSHLSAVMFMNRAGIEGTLIPYRGGGDAVVALLGGQTDLYSANISEIMGQIESGKLRFLAVSSLQPIPQLTGVPTIAATYPGYTIETWNGLMGPAGLPSGVVDQLASAVDEMLGETRTLARLSAAGVIPQRGQTKLVFARRIQNDVAMWRPMMAQAGISPE